MKFIEKLKDINKEVKNNNSYYLFSLNEFQTQGHVIVNYNTFEILTYTLMENGSQKADIFDNHINWSYDKNKAFITTGYGLEAHLDILGLRNKYKYFTCLTSSYLKTCQEIKLQKENNIIEKLSELSFLEYVLFILKKFLF